MFFLFLCVTVEDIMRHFTNMRTDHFKLKNAVKTTPSGSGAAKVLTPLQHLKVHGYSFLDPFYRPRTSKTDTCGKVSICKQNLSTLPLS